MIYAYVRISTDKQHKENQRYEILNYIDEQKLAVDKWVYETASGNKSYKKRMLAILIDNMKKDDMLITTEISRLGRSIIEIMSILNELMQKGIKIHTTKEGYDLGDDINSKVLAFAFSLSAEVERKLISQRTKEALHRIKLNGKKLGRPKGKLSTNTKLSGKDDLIIEYLKNNISKSAIARLFKVNRKTIARYIKTRKLDKIIQK